MYITKKLQDAPNQKEKDEILETLKNSSMVIYFFINMFGIYDFQSHSKKTHRLIALVISCLVKQILELFFIKIDP